MEPAKVEGSVLGAIYLEFGDALLSPLKKNMASDHRFARAVEETGLRSKDDGKSLPKAERQRNFRSD
jgi:hypothetical protein